MQTAITTKWLSPTNAHGSRVKANGKDGRQSVTDPWNYGDNVQRNHCRVAMLLAAKLGWTGLYVAGMNGDSGYVYVHVVTDNLRGWNYAEGMAGDWRRDPNRAFGIEGEDWFYLPEREEK